MKFAFIHDHVFKNYNNRYFSDGKLTDKTWKRYLAFSDNLHVIARELAVSNYMDVENLNETVSEHVSFSCIKAIGFFDRICRYRVKKKLRVELGDVDVVVCRLPSFLGSVAFDVANKLNKKTIVELVGCPLDAFSNHGSILGKIIAPIESLILKRIMLKAKYTIYVTAEFLQSRYPCYGLSINASNVELANFSNQVLIKDKAKVIKFIGSLSCSYKGFDDLLKALFILKLSGEDIILHVLGSGGELKYQKKIVEFGLSDRVVFFSPMKGGDAVLDWLSEGDLYVQPSHTEGLPRALIEAMSIGLPCVATNVGGIPELIEETFLCNPKSPEDLSSKIKLLISSKSLRLEQALLNFNKAKSYRVEVLESKRLNFIKEVIKL